MRILLAGTFAGVPGQGGATWAVLQYALGFERIGHEVLLVEPAPADRAVIAYFDQVVDAHGLRGRAALLHGGRSTSGMTWTALVAASKRADVLINLAGVLTDEELIAHVPLRVYVDLDPAFTQLWDMVAGIDMHLGGHHRFVTVGQAIGSPGCSIPTCGMTWIPTVPPVVLDLWPVTKGWPRFGLTTVGNWRSYGSITWCGTHYGQKAHSVRKLLAIPMMLPEVVVEPALSLHPAEEIDLTALEAAGWRLQEPGLVSGDPDSYQAFVQDSTAELGVAKAGYVVSRCGWFSDRSACYLASGRPVIAEDTGWPGYLPAGAGLLAFDDAASAAAAAREVLGDYDRHCKGARAIAEEHFDARQVLTRRLEQVGA
jgi:hypothetical protein